MAYTGGETVTLTAGQTLEGPSSIANTLLTGADEYARILYASNATLGTVSVSSGGQLYLRGNDTTVNSINVQGLYTYNKTAVETSGGRLFISGGKVDELTLDNEGLAWMYGGEVTNLILSKTDTSLVSSVKLRISAGTVMGGSNAGNAGAKEIYAWGGVVSNFTMNANAYIFASNGGYFKDCSFNGTWFAIRGGTAERVTFLNAATQSHNRMSTGLMSDCTIVAGASYTAIGGKAIGTVVSGANARFRVSGAAAVMEGGTVLSGGSILVSIGKASGVTVGSSGWMLVSGQNAVAENIVQNGQSANAGISAGGTINGGTITNSANLTVFTNGTANDMKILTSAMMVIRNAGVVNNVTVSGASARFIASNGGVVNNPVINEFGAWGYASSGAVINNAAVYNGGRLLIYSGGTALDPNVSQTIAVPTGASMARIEVSSGGYVSGGTGGNANRRTIEVYVRGGGTVEGMTFLPGAFVLCAGTVKDCFMAQDGAQQVTIRAGLLQGGTATSKATITISSGTVSGVVLRNGANINCINIGGASAGKLVKDVVIQSGGTVTMRNNGSGGAVGLFSAGVVMSGGSLVVSNTGVARDVRVEQGAVAYTYNAANFSGGQIFGALRVTNGGKTSGALIQSGGVHHVSMGGSALDTVVYDGGAIRISSGAVIRAQVQQGGSLYMNYEAQTLVAPTVAQGAYVSAHFGVAATPRTAAVMDDASNFNATLTIEIPNVATTYTIASEVGNANMTVSPKWLMFDNIVTAGEVYVNPFLSTRGKFTLSDDGKTLTAANVSTTSVNAAKSLFVNGDVLGTKHGATANPNDRAAIWNGTVLGTVTESVAIAEGGTDGDVWFLTANSLKVDAPLFGAAKDQNFAGNVNYYFQQNFEIRNLAAGADYGGSVGGVNIFANTGTFKGVAYAGGFGTVTNDINIQVSNNTTEFEKDFYAGALYNANKVAASITTSVGDIITNLGNGTYDGNVYGASAVKAGTITTVENQAALHTVDDVTLTIAGGSATKDTVCVFAGGYATGHDTAKLAPVYTVESVTATISGGDWGGAHGGRGVFGGAMASDNIGSDGVWAKVGDVDLTISGGTMGNVFGGGWAQKGAKSEVGNVNLTIKGGTIANVFGGGSHSTSGGTTAAGDITITVSGGTITGDIFARGQLDGDATGSAEVVFTGATAFGCNVWGYSYVPEQGMPGVGEGATLSYTGYTGTFSGSIGGFDSITFDGDTKMTIALGEGKTLSNAAWTFDLEERAEIFAENSLLTWAGADFSGDKVTVNFADEAQAKAGWSIADASFTGATFDLWIGGAATAAVDLALGAAIEGTGTAYDGWGFTMEESTLKFKQLA